MITSQITTHIPKIVHIIHLYQQTFDLGCGHIYMGNFNYPRQVIFLNEFLNGFGN
jgi:hypothetical protein